MGMFDSVYATCPTCGSEIEFQSKGGRCCLASYRPDNAPLNVLSDVIGDREAQSCQKCRTLVRIVVSFRAWAEPVANSNADGDRIAGRGGEES